MAYEVLAVALGSDRIGKVRNGADVLLKNMFAALGGRYGVTLFGTIVLGWGAVLVWRDLRSSGALRLRVFPLMLVEAMVYASLLGGVAATLTTLLLAGPLQLAAPQGGAGEGGGTFEQLELPTQLMISLGAGIYEELLFRVLMVGGLAAAARVVLGWSAVPAAIIGALLGSLAFSLFHYVGPHGDVFTLSSFTFRAVAGLLFSALYLLRGFGITAWSHALYDVFLAVSRY
jgi:hypothetical protein